MLKDADDRIVAIVGLVVAFLATIVIVVVAILAGISKEMLKDVIQAFAPVWTAIVGALGGIAKGKG